MANKTKQGGFLASTLLVSGSRFFQSLFSYFIVLAITHTLGVEGLGQYAFIFAFAQIAFLFSDLGLNYYLLQKLSETKKDMNKHFAIVFTAKICLGLLFLMIYTWVIGIINQDHLYVLLLLVGLLEVIIILRNVCYLVYRAHNDAHFYAFINFFERCCVFVGAMVSLMLYGTLEAFIISYVLIELVILMIVLIHLRKYISTLFAFNRSYLKKAIKHSYPFMLILFFASIYIQIDSIMLYFMKSDVVVGLYNAGYKLINVLSVIPVLLLTFGFSKFAELYHKDTSQLHEFFEQTLFYVLIIGVPITFGGILYAGDIIKFIYDIDEVVSYQAFQILLFAQVPIFLSTMYSNLLAAVGEQKVFSKISGVGALLNILLNIILISHYSLLGAAWATWITYMFMYYIMKHYTDRHLVSISIVKLILLPVICSSIMVWWLVLIGDIGHVVFNVAMGAILYGVLILLYHKIWGVDKLYKLFNH